MSAGRPVSHITPATHYVGVRMPHQLRSQLEELSELSGTSMSRIVITVLQSSLPHLLERTRARHRAEADNQAAA